MGNRNIGEKIKLGRWQRELDKLCRQTGKSLQDICRYLDVSFKRDIGFYVKIPKKRRTIIGIGMALYQPLEVINRWIVYYGNKRKLYSKDITEDLIWIFLINSNFKNSDDSHNYYRDYDKFREIAYELYYSIWSDLISGSKETSNLDEALASIGANAGCENFKNFVITNIDSFKTAYAKPRRMLRDFCQCILKAGCKFPEVKGSNSLISLRGWLDDSMINYLSGSPETVNVTNVRTGERVSGFKQIPKSRRSHISLALALGMTREEIDRYLVLMGYAPLDDENTDEHILINELEQWEDTHRMQRLLKDKYINGDDTIVIDKKGELAAVGDMLTLRQELRDRFKRRGMEFIYMKA